MAEIIHFSELAQRRSGSPPGRAAGAAPTAAAPVDQRRSFAFLVERYLLHHQREHSSPRTLDIYRSALDGMVRFFEDCGWRTDLDNHPRAILEHARAWAENFQARPSARGQAYSAASVHQYVRSARAFSTGCSKRNTPTSTTWPDWSAHGWVRRFRAPSQTSR